MISVNYFHQNARVLRSITGKNQAEMGASIGFGRSSWGNYETGVSQPSLEDTFRIAQYFGITVGQLLEVDLSKNVNLIAKKRWSKKEDFVNPNVNPSVNPKVDFKQLEHQKFIVSEPDQELVKHRMPQVITVDTMGNENVVFVPVRARAGYLNGYSDPKFMEKLPAYRLPGLNMGTFRLFEVQGESMYPTFHSGDIVIGSFVEQLRDVRDDRIYVVMTKHDGVVVKRALNRIEKDGKLILKSDNYKDRDQYPALVVNPQDILEVWYATGFISRQMRPPAETYNRVIDLEGRLTLVEELLKQLPKK